MKQEITNGYLSKIVILLGIVLAVIAFFIAKNKISETLSSTKGTTEQQLNRYFIPGQPVFALFHSYNKL